MKNSILFSLVFSTLTALAVPVSFADEVVEPSAPAVVAPGQPAAPEQAAVSQASAAPAAQQPGLLGMALPFVVMLGIMYFLMIRPQQKRMKEHQTLISGLKNGDEVITSAGILGTVAGMSDKVVTLEVSKNVQLKVLKSQVNQVVKGQIKDLQTNV
jgi:preprotein translocase subunit YajC